MKRIFGKPEKRVKRHSVEGYIGSSVLLPEVLQYGHVHEDDPDSPFVLLFKYHLAPKRDVKKWQKVKITLSLCDKRYK